MYPIWETTYGLGFETTWGTGVEAGTSIPTGGPKGIALTNLVTNFDPGMNIVDVRKASGGPVRRADIYEFMQGTKSPVATLEFQADPTSLIPFLVTLFQPVNTANIFEAAGTPFRKIFTNYIIGQDFAAKAATPLKRPFLLSITKNVQVDNKNQRLVSSICRSLTLSSEEGQPLNASAEMIAKNLETNIASLSVGTFTLPTLAPFMFQDAVFGIANTTNMDGSDPVLALTEVPCTSFSITISNNTTIRYGTTQTATQYILGDFTVEGSFTLPWGWFEANQNFDVETFVAGTPSRWGIYWLDADGSIANSLSIAFNARLTGVEETGDDEKRVNVSFQGVQSADADGGADAQSRVVEIGMCDNTVDWTFTTP